jgi:hypothetical protein
MLGSDRPSTDIQECLRVVGIALLAEWDVLIFLYRHRASLASAEQIARLLGHPSKAVGLALERLESLKMVQRSRSSQGVRFYRFVSSEAQLAPDSCFRRLLSLAENRPGRLLLVKHLRPGSGLYVTAARGKTE